MSPRPERVRGRRHAHRRAGSRTGALLIPISAVAAVTAVVVGAYVLVSAAGPSGRSAQAATLTVTARHAVALLEQERQQMIVMADASRSQKVLVGPKVESKATPAAAKGTGSPSSTSPVPPLAPVDPGTARADAESLMPSFGFSVSSQFGCLDNLWSRESGWRTTAENPSGAYGIPQALPGSKMASAGADWQTNDKTQIKWGLGYIKDRYSTPCGAWAYWQANGSY
ncbi:MAG: lytic transglycosylase domain-containing protein [Micromonosporaceae bacterium]